jgi:predicted dehydrogenase
MPASYGTLSPRIAPLVTGVAPGNNGAMKLGLLGIDEQVAWVLAAAGRRGDEVALACDVPAGSPHAGFFAAAARTQTWESLLDARGCDAVLVGSDGWNEARAEAVRKLVQAGRTLVLSQPLELSMLFAYELDMIRKDSGARLVPILPDRLHPFVAVLRREIEASLGGAGPLGPIETITFERRMRDRDRDAVLAQLSRDADLVRVLTGDPRRLSTLGGGDPATVWSTLAVGFHATGSLPVRWTVMRGDSPGLTLSIVGAAGTHLVEIPDGAEGDWTSRLLPSDRTDRAGFDRGAAILDLLHGGAAIADGSSDIPPAAWDDAARAIELAETAPRSVAKGRAIDLHQEEFSELGTFKGTMASLGCAIVLGGLFVLLLATLIGGIAKEAGWGLGERIAGVWPVAVLVMLGLFLALQLLPLIVGAPPPKRRPQIEEPARGGRE